MTENEKRQDPQTEVISGDPRLALQGAVKANRLVNVSLTTCDYRCCGGGWTHRDDLYQTYERCQVLSVDGESVLLQTNALGKIAEIMAALSDIVRVELVD